MYKRIYMVIDTSINGVSYLFLIEMFRATGSIGRGTNIRTDWIRREWMSSRITLHPHPFAIDDFFFLYGKRRDTLQTARGRRVDWSITPLKKSNPGSPGDDNGGRCVSIATSNFRTNYSRPAIL